MQRSPEPPGTASSSSPSSLVGAGADDSVLAASVLGVASLLGVDSLVVAGLGVESASSAEEQALTVLTDMRASATVAA